MSAQRTDPYPYYRAAGITTKTNATGAQLCIQPSVNENNRPETPADIQKYRNSHLQKIGSTIVHYGKYDDHLPGEKHVYGLEDRHSNHVPDCLKNDNIDGFKSVLNNFNEEIYQSKKLQPLGRKAQRNYNFPEETQQDGFRFGTKTVDSETTAKHLIQSGKNMSEPQDIQKMYNTSHGFTKPGQQQKRDYSWPFNPDQHVFGKKFQIGQNQAQRCLQPENDGCFEKTDIVQKNVEDFRDFAGDHLGKVKNLGQTGSLYDPNTIFGQTKRVDQWDVGQCIKGDATFDEAYIDPKLGRSTKIGRRNLPHEGDEDRIFGAPSIRHDIGKPKQISVANTNNFGDEPGALELIFPHCYTHYGLQHEDIVDARNKEDIREIFSNIGFNYKAGKFEGIWMRALEIQNSRDDKVSVEAFLMAIKEMHYIK